MHSSANKYLRASRNVTRRFPDIKVNLYHKQINIQMQGLQLTLKAQSKLVVDNILKFIFVTFQYK